MKSTRWFIHFHQQGLIIFAPLIIIYLIDLLLLANFDWIIRGLSFIVFTLYYVFVLKSRPYIIGLLRISSVSEKSFKLMLAAIGLWLFAVSIKPYTQNHDIVIIFIVAISAMFLLISFFSMAYES
ncbi:hypothetical protein [Sandaracinobacteroides saxicola]|uniref:Uncharacterized protein n=1 Tax=Sandaracinobacteroides saxicola TaxID=2759707 RepID=A0A7G5IGH6_9SPHN|nr:hypothetical protein [Sandaracinobacteroides saxicola]QMW22468.1 hypothetical protein H3309_14160 [Sandaracinobacteroides saxicola]